MTHSLAASTLQQIRDGWAGEFDVPVEVFAEPGSHTFGRDDAGSLVVVTLEGAQVAVGTPEAIERLETLAPEHRADVEAVLTVLHGLQPEPLGSASLSYVERVLVPTGIEVAVGPVQNVDMLRDHCTQEEWDESGLIDMPARVAARRPDGKVAAVAGYERWGQHLAQLGVLTDPQWRGMGYAAAAAARAAQVSQNEALVPQWRCRVGNTASEDVAQRLGFQRIGHQLAILLG
ncbi:MULTISPECIES: GNAT family N-acetyltransferase [unclassified Nocardioides]|uniref:GNAT family N-acetyltransferase n=1 Tax=unclassified Nocardioides TaxID=2615069 RepID=UPI000700115F|nr:MULTISPECIES: GNAT family protein [unclassified Nocardioides]KQY64412.1 hypothetical protein ASD30_05610 [Nocardioides sp. Root140]KRF18183.1 hypothetical protein ASH02_00995 [Nocardioides sp. Soil796]